MLTGKVCSLKMCNDSFFPVGVVQLPGLQIHRKALEPDYALKYMV